MSTLPIHFAPLQGYTEASYRNAHAAIFGGVDTYHTPFVRIDRGDFRYKDVRDIDPVNNSVPQLIPQLIAPNAELAERMIHLFIEKGYTAANINLGCPFPMLTKRHNGSGILPYPEEVKELLRVIEKFPQIRFSAKMRLGFSEASECLALAPLLNDTSLSEITLHPRLGVQQYKGDVDLEAFSAFYDACKLPIIYNGDLHTVEDIQRITERFPKLSGIMIGRGLLTNPALACEYKEGQILTSDQLKEKLQLLHNGVFAHYESQLQGGEKQLVVKMKAFWEYLAPQIDRKAWKAIHKSTTLNKYNIAIQAALTLGK